uniref:NADH-ubiquinone oxidoreductase chain 2 n=1 Tax=Pseudostegana amoena TaxID=1509422 RepID=A0A068CR35_9MUSC|nr:NADH dehydrogenase subunit 2 [Pseudostegana amoena]AID22234.1 NADH dehydrogenase subunit 2 [Pseudostegana amoena]
MFNSSKILFMMIMMTGTMITVTSNSWLSAWMGLEINLLSFIPLMSDSSNSNNPMSTESSLKYFLTQALASTVLLFSIVLMMLKNIIIELNYSYISMMTLSSLLMKSGAAPFHFWFPNMMEGMTWANSLILLTWQKIAPLILISHINLNFLLKTSVILSVIIGALGGMNQTSLRKLMAFSSINHLGWMLSSLNISEMSWMIYFLFYSFLSITIIFMFNIFKMFHFNQMFSMFFNSKMMKFFLFTNFLSLGGLPPFLGFLPKWLVIQQLSMNNNFFLLFIMILSSLITLFFYLRICYSTFMLNYYENNWMLNLNSNFYSLYFCYFLSFFSIFGLIIISSLYFIL